jgi:hypothetical protein
LMERQNCDRCGSAGSIEFEMCQVCFKDYSKAKDSGIRRLKLIGHSLMEETKNARPLVTPVAEGMVLAFST